jgi:hypothetical protein
MKDGDGEKVQRNIRIKVTETGEEQFKMSMTAYGRIKKLYWNFDWTQTLNLWMKRRVFAAVSLLLVKTNKMCWRTGWDVGTEANKKCHI